MLTIYTGKSPRILLMDSWQFGLPTSDRAMAGRIHDKENTTSEIACRCFSGEMFDCPIRF